jgi:oxygen-independent coproporphyrinogen III oxidase
MSGVSRGETMPHQRPSASVEPRLPRYTSYPTAPNFHQGVDAALYRQWLGAIEPGAVVSLYLHVPFCPAMCWYCGCHTTVAKSYGPIAGYAALLAREIDMVAAAMPFRPRVSHIHWGGGTPNMMAGDDLQRISERIAERFELDPETEIAAELDPRGLDRDKARALAGCGVNRASIGVQDLDSRVQSAINRHQPYDITASAVALLRDHGIDRINADLMYGLPYQTVQGIDATIDQVVSLAPDRIALFGYAHVPWMKPHQRRIPAETLPDAPARAAQYAAASDRIASRGYCRIGIDHFARPEDALAMAAANGMLHRNFQGYTTDDSPLLIGLGASAIGSLPQGYVQNETTIAGWRESIAAGRFATRRGRALNENDRLRRAIIERLMCDLSVDLRVECSERGVDPADFEAECMNVDALAASGLGWREGWRLGVGERDRPLVRVVCAVFDRYLDRGAVGHSRAI